MLRRSGEAAVRRRALRGLAALVAIGSTLLTLSGCGVLNGSASNPAGSGQVEKPAIRLAGAPTVDRAVIDLALEKGYFAEEGLHVSVQDVTGGADSAKKLSTGEADFSSGSYPPVITEQARNAGDFKFVAELLVSKPNLQPLMVPENSPLKGPEDIRDKRVAVTGRGTITELAAKSVLRDKGIDFNRIQWIPMGSADMPAALQRGDVDAAVMREPHTTMAAQAFGARTIFDTFSGATEDFPVSGVTTTAEFARKNPKTVQAFQRAINKAKFAALDQRELTEMLPRHAKVPPGVAPLIELGRTPLSTEVSRLQRVATLLYSFELTPHEVDVGKMVLPPPPAPVK